MLGKKIQIGLSGVIMSVASTLVSLLMYLNYLSYNNSSFKTVDVFALVIISVSISFILAYILDDVLYSLSSKRRVNIKVINKISNMGTFAGRGSRKISYSYRIEYYNESINKTGVIFCSKEDFDMIGIENHVNCIVKGNMLIEVVN